LKNQMTGYITALLFMFVVLTACAGVKPKAQLTVGEIVAAPMASIDLTRNQLFCTGQKREKMDRVEGITVKGVVCEEAKHISFAYLFNEEPFFFAIMEINDKRDVLTPLLGYAALERRGLMLPVDLKSKPRLPIWAYDSNGQVKKSIYRNPEESEPAGSTRMN